LRHPFVAARAFQTLDVLSGGRVEAGFGAGWLAGEFVAAGIDFAGRGNRMDESLEVCQRLWSQPKVEHSGRHFRFPPVAFEPKPVQRPWPRIHIGGESDAAMRRAARFGRGWLGTEHSPESAADAMRRLRRCEKEFGTGERLEVTVAAGTITGAKDLPAVDQRAVDAFGAAGVDRIIVSPWRRSAEAVAAVHVFAETHL
jgi:alkanesulfonate monooxygenase SsuD/methylene tetrahydromethanopterin reductase-like flavin-dependent oxidoreductase (luciferase family)